MSARRRRIGLESQQSFISVPTDVYGRNETEINYSDSPFFGTFSDNSFPFETDLIMAARDRTKEFSSTIQNLQSRQIAKALNVRESKKSVYVQSHAQFMTIARAIGKNVANTYSKLEKLTLCKYILMHNIYFFITNFL